MDLPRYSIWNLYIHHEKLNSFSNFKHIFNVRDELQHFPIRLQAIAHDKLLMQSIFRRPIEFCECETHMKVNLFQLIKRHYFWESILIPIYLLDAYNLKRQMHMWQCDEKKDFWIFYFCIWIQLNTSVSLTIEVAGISCGTVSNWGRK